MEQEPKNTSDSSLRTIVFSWKPVVKKDGEKFKFLKLWGNLTTIDVFEKLPAFMRSIIPPHIVLDEDICHYYVDFTSEPKVIFNLEVGDVESEELEKMVAAIREVVHYKKMYFSTEHAEDDEGNPTIFTLFLKLNTIQYD